MPVPISRNKLSTPSAVLARFMSEKRACSPRSRTSTGSMRQSQAEPLPPTAPRPPCGSLSMLAGFQSGSKRGSVTKTAPRWRNPPTPPLSMICRSPQLYFVSCKV